MRRTMMLIVLVVAMLDGAFAFAAPTSAQGGRCRAFGQNIAGLAKSLGRDFGQTASSTAPLNDTVETEQTALCN